MNLRKTLQMVLEQNEVALAQHHEIEKFLAPLEGKPILTKSIEKLLPDIYLMIEGGNLVSVQATEKGKVFLFDADNAKADNYSGIPENVWASSISNLEAAKRLTDLEIE